MKVSDVSNLTSTAVSKPWYASKTVWGSLIGAASLIGGFFGVHTDPATQALAVNGVTATAAGIGGVISTALTLYGRLTATKTIG